MEVIPSALGEEEEHLLRTDFIVLGLIGEKSKS